MRLTDYIKDHILSCLLALLLVLFTILLLSAVRVDKGIIIMLSVCMASVFTFIFLIEYAITSKRLRQLNEKLETLDKKYLVLELLEESTNIESKQLYEIMGMINRSYIEQLSTLENSIEEFKEYVEMWIHEVKLPIASLFLQSHNNNYPQELVTQVKRIDRYTEQILYYVRSEATSLDFLIQPIPLRDLVRKVILKNREDLTTLNFEIDVSIKDEVIYTDTKWMEFILNQLISNAIKYRKDNPKLTIYSASSIEDTSLIIEDRGIGIEASDLSKVFNKSFTGINGRKSSTSTGYGLYIVKKLCTKLGHQIEIQSEPNQYTKVIIKIGKNNLYHADN